MSNGARGLHDDPLSAASAGLVALGIDRARRVDVLEVLGCLIDHADVTGHVVLDQVLFLREEALGVDKCLDAYAVLEELDVVRRTERGWRIVGYAAHNGPVGETEASLAVLRKHLASVGRDTEEAEPEAATPPPVMEPIRTPVGVAAMGRVTPLRRTRRAVPIAAGLAASAAVFAGVTQFIPQAAVSGRNAAVTADAPTTAKPRGNTPTSNLVTGSTVGGPATTAGAGTATTAATPTTPGPGGAACVVPNVVATVTSIEITRVGLLGNGLWSAVVQGTATLRDSEDALLLPALDVVVHLANGDTAPVKATLVSPLLQPGTPAPFSTFVALGADKPAEAPRATATAVGLPTCPPA